MCLTYDDLSCYVTGGLKMSRPGGSNAQARAARARRALPHDICLRSTLNAKGGCEGEIVALEVEYFLE